MCNERRYILGEGTNVRRKIYAAGNRHCIGRSLAGKDIMSERLEVFVTLRVALYHFGTFDHSCA
jgi:hypothetical protein